MAVSPKCNKPLVLFVFLVLALAVGCKPTGERVLDPQTGALVSPVRTPLPLPTHAATLISPLPTPFSTPWPPDFTPSPTPPPSPTPAGVPYIITDPVNHFTMTVLPGWYAITPDANAVGGITSITSYDMRLVDNPPPSSKSIHITISQLDAGQSFEQWLSNQRARETSPDYGALGVILTEPQPYMLGEYIGVTYTAIDSSSKEGVTIIYMLARDRRIVGIGVRPISALALSEVKSMLSTLDVLPITPP
jgi:hypothetical protein